MRLMAEGASADKSGGGQASLLRLEEPGQEAPPTEW